MSAAQKPSVGLRATLSAVPGPQGLPLLPRGGGGEELYAGDPTCTPNANTGGLGLASVGAAFFPECEDGVWASFAFPVLTGGATIESVNIVFSTAGQADGGDLYLMGDCGGNPDTNNILFTGCGCLQGNVPNEVTNYPIGDPLVDPPAIVWVVTVYSELAGDPAPPIWFIAFDGNQAGPDHAFANFSSDPSCGSWTDLNLNGFGGCYWVSLLTADSPAGPPCCDSPAMCDGDVNGDGLVDPLDSGFILARFGLDASDPANCQADANCDGLIDPLDSGYVLARFGLCNEPTLCPLGGGIPGECGEDPPGDSCAQAPSADCCEVHSEPGCNAVCGAPDDGGVEDCVCAVDDFCCMVTWDSACVEIVELFGCADCSDNNPDCAGGGGGECPDGGPDNDCCENVPVDVLTPGDGLTYDATLSGANLTCDALGALGETWHAFSIASTENVTGSHCGTSPVFGNAFIVIDNACPCSGAFIFADAFDQVTCADGNWAVHYVSLPAGDYWTPIILDPAFGNDGPYVWNINID